MNTIGIVLSGHNFYNDVQTMVQTFYPNMSYKPCESIFVEHEIVVESIKSEKEIICRQYFEKKVIAESHMNSTDSEDENKHNIKMSIYITLKKIRHIELKWGILTGIRPAKKVTEYFKKGFSENEIREILHRKFLVDHNKIKLAIEVSKNESNILNSKIIKDGFSLYVGIPFCPAKCLYCSFTSYPVKKHEAITMPYVEALCSELKEISIRTAGKQLQSIYIGGGTPTALKASELFLILSTIDKCFNIGNADEFTVEAGRPDTLDKEKLQLLKDFGVTRISINPQTMNEKTLEKVGRNHSVNELLNVYSIAREMNFDNINMDTILALPEEELTDIEYTFRQLQRLSPDSITVHTLAVKRASALKDDMSVISASAEMTEEMISIADNIVREMGQTPYYMYRQKNSVGNFENVGYSLKGRECLYNILIMEECQSIYAAGAGAVTKTVDKTTNRIEREFNVKNVEEYIKRIRENEKCL